MARGRFGEADDIPPHMHHRALLREHCPEEGRADLLLQILGAEKRRIGIDLSVDRLEVAGDRLARLRPGAVAVGVV